MTRRIDPFVAIQACATYAVAAGLLVMLLASGDPLFWRVVAGGGVWIVIRAVKLRR